MPSVGDPASAVERCAEPSGWAYCEATIEALGAVIAARRDLRRRGPTRSCRASCAGFSPPAMKLRRSGTASRGEYEQTTWDRAALLADRKRLRQAELLATDRRFRLLDLHLDEIREARWVS